MSGLEFAPPIGMVDPTPMASGLYVTLLTKYL